jgi:glucose/arabinose dehydrogenase
MYQQVINHPRKQYFMFYVSRFKFYALLLGLLMLLPACGMDQANAPEQQSSSPTQPASTPTQIATQPTSPTILDPTVEPIAEITEAMPTNTPEPTPSTEQPTSVTLPATPIPTLEAATATPSPAPPLAATPPPTEAPSAALVPPLESLEIKLISVASGFTKPTFITHAGDGSGRLFIVEQAGRILMIKDGVVNPTPFLEIVSLVGSDANEQGLLSVAFHPNYRSNGYFFVNYTNKQGDTIIARYTVSANPDVADPNSAKILLTIDQPYANHNGGQVIFGPDGYLYIGMGDGGAANDPHNNAQNLGAWLGKILRIDVDSADPYGVPPDNPFIGHSEAQPEIWSYGWRNPWRFSFDRATNDMYIADVGQNQYEEVHVELAGTSGGQNYGWRLMEGFHCFEPADCDPASQGLVLPIAEYDHTQGCSITGGYVYRGQQYPALNGVYFYADYCSGNIWGLRREANGAWSQTQLLASGQTISSFGEDEAGEVYLTQHRTGEIFQIGN